MPTSSAEPVELASFERIVAAIAAGYAAHSRSLDLALARLQANAVVSVASGGARVAAHGASVDSLARFTASVGAAFGAADRGTNQQPAGGSGPTATDRPGGVRPIWPTEGEPGFFSDEDRNKRTLRWHEANLYNLQHANSYLYDTPAKRRDFYRWLYEYLTARGFQLMWPLNAYMVAASAAALVNTHLLFSHNLEEPFLNANQVIFDDMFPKFARIASGPVLTGDAAFRVDVRLVVEEQNLVAPIYARMSSNQLEALQHVAAGTGLQGRAAAIANITADVGYKGGAFNHGGESIPPVQGRVEDVTTRINYGITLGIDVRTDPSKASLKKLPDGVEDVARDTKAAGGFAPLVLPSGVEKYQEEIATTAYGPDGFPFTVTVKVDRYRVRPGVVPPPSAAYRNTNSSNQQYAGLAHEGLNRIDSVIDNPDDANRKGQRAKVVESLGTLNPTEQALLLSPTRTRQLRNFVISADNPADRDRILAALPLSSAEKQVWRDEWLRLRRPPS